MRVIQYEIKAVVLDENGDGQALGLRQGTIVVPEAEDGKTLAEVGAALLAQIAGGK